MVAENLKKNVYAKVQTIYKNTNKSAQEIEDIAHNQVKLLLDMIVGQAEDQGVDLIALSK